MLKAATLISKLTLIFLIFLLAACAPAVIVEPTATIQAGPGVPGQSLATPVFGGVTVLPMPGKTVLELRSWPDPNAAFIGQVEPGDLGRLLGVDASGRWMFVEIEGQTGWVPIQYLDYTIAQ